MAQDDVFQLRGLLRPFRRDRKADFAARSGEALIRAAVGQILGTMAASEFTPGELPWNTSFGSHLHLLRHQKNDALLQELARIHVVDAVKRWEPRIRVTSVQIMRERDRGENVLAIRLRYVIAVSQGRPAVSGEPETAQLLIMWSTRPANSTGSKSALPVASTAPERSG